jgi:hypothetical protein
MPSFSRVGLSLFVHLKSNAWADKEDDIPGDGSRGRLVVVSRVVLKWSKLLQLRVACGGRDDEEEEEVGGGAIAARPVGATATPDQRQLWNPVRVQLAGIRGVLESQEKGSEERRPPATFIFVLALPRIRRRICL